jgi:hypothetical protein
MRINNNMNNTSDKSFKADPAKKGAKPNETGSVYVEAYVKIFDPNTKEVMVEKRA